MAIFLLHELILIFANQIGSYAWKKNDKLNSTTKIKYSPDKPQSLETMDGGYIGGRQTTQEFVPIEERGIPRAMVTDRSVRKL